MTRTKILLVCTANQCRSPLAAAIARRGVEKLPIDFDSAGLLEGGHTMPPVGIRVAGEIGLDLTGHISRQLNLRAAHSYAVILTMTREQAREIVATAPDLWPRVFTLKQFARWLHDHPYPGGSTLGSWLKTEASDRAKTDLVGSNASDDVRDPLTSPARVWRSVANELQDQISSILSGLSMLT
ncbi:MAG: hypothetical protein ABI400_13150 [Lacisediminihabitans sp.]